MTGRERHALTWRKSSFSGASNCVEVATSGDLVFIRDSKDPEGPVLTTSLDQWRAFVEYVRRTYS